MIPAGTYADHYGATDLTAPVVAVTLEEKVAAVDRFGLDAANALDDWTVVIDPDLDGWVIRWTYARLTVGERSDLDLARFIVVERTRARQQVDHIAQVARLALGWGRGEPRVRCVVCRVAAGVTEQHAPGGLECRDTQRERAHAHAS